MCVYLLIYQALSINLACFSNSTNLLILKASFPTLMVGQPLLLPSPQAWTMTTTMTSPRHHYQSRPLPLPCIGRHLAVQGACPLQNDPGHWVGLQDRPRESQIQNQSKVNDVARLAFQFFSNHSLCSCMRTIVWYVPTPCGCTLL